MRLTTMTFSIEVPRSRAPSAVALVWMILPLRYLPSAVMSILHLLSSIRSLSDSELKPPKTMLCIAPILAQASMEMASSGIIGR